MHKADLREEAVYLRGWLRIETGWFRYQSFQGPNPPVRGELLVEYGVCASCECMRKAVGTLLVPLARRGQRTVPRML